MKNYKLDVVRYNNEDVIATSGAVARCTVDLNEYDSIIYIINNKGSGNYEYYKWNDIGNMFQLQGATPPFALDDSSLSSCSDSLENSKFYHYNSSSHAFVECTIHSYHHLPSPLVSGEEF